MSERNPFGQANSGGWCECAACGRIFGALSGFDAHRIRVPGPEHDWRCATDAEIEAKGLHLSARGWWVREGRFAPRPSTRTAAEM